MKKPTAHLQYSWWKYLLVAMLSITIWCIVFDALSAPKKNQQIRITCIGDDFACSQLQTALEQELPKKTSQRIRKIAVESPINGESTDYFTVMTTRAHGADLIIAAESAMTEIFGQSYFKPLPVEKLPESLQGLSYYTENGEVYGILLYDGTTQNRFSQFYSGSERCYVFITHKSENAAGILGVGNETDDAALRCIEYLLEEI